MLTYIAELNTQLYSNSGSSFHMCHTLPPSVKACPHALSKKTDRAKEKMDRMKYREWDPNPQPSGLTTHMFDTGKTHDKW